MGKKDRNKGKAKRSPAHRKRGWLYITIAVGLIGVIVLTVSLVSGTGSPGDGNTVAKADTVALPAWLARSPASTKEAYVYAVEHPETLNYIPCYCGCGAHSGHRSAHDCFVASHTGSSVVYDDHGANCAMCIDIALITKKMTAQGRSLAEAKQAVVQKYSSLGPPTNTPPLPQG